MIIRLNGLKEVTIFLNNLPKKLDKKIKNEAIMDLAKNLQKRIKRKVPINSGWTRRSVMIEKGKGFVKVVINSHYAEAIEKGRGPNKKGGWYIPKAYLEQSTKHPDMPGRYVKNAKRWVNLKNTPASRPRPFIKPAMDSLRPKISNILNRYLNEAITSSK